MLGQEANIPPDVLLINDLTCKIQQHGKNRWTAKGIASYVKHENYHHEPWETPPFPERKSNAASLKDCNRWFDAVHRVQAVTKPVDVNELRKQK